MAHYRSLDSISLTDTWLTIGVFDGVHRGHQEIIHRLVSGARAEGRLPIVLTFTPHPAIVLGGRKDFKCLTTPDERAELLFELGVEHVITQTFNLSLAAQTAEEFMRRLVWGLGMRRLLIGHDFALGRDREGNAARLAAIGETLSYHVDVIPPLADERGIISSTRIRQAVEEGDLASAIADLGHTISLRGEIIHGDGRGRHINIPTANIHVPPNKAVPANGVYATWAWVKGERKASVTNIGIHPTFTPDLTLPNVETHILDFKRNLYDQELRLDFVARLRAEQKFPSVEALIRQIKADIARAREILKAQKM